jgi:hypothetical protein
MCADARPDAFQRRGGRKKGKQYLWAGTLGHGRTDCGVRAADSSSQEGYILRSMDARVSLGQTGPER